MAPRTNPVTPGNGPSRGSNSPRGNNAPRITDASLDDDRSRRRSIQIPIGGTTTTREWVNVKPSYITDPSTFAILNDLGVLADKIDLLTEAVKRQGDIGRARTTPGKKTLTPAATSGSHGERPDENGNDDIFHDENRELMEALVKSWAQETKNRFYKTNTKGATAAGKNFKEASLNQLREGLGAADESTTATMKRLISTFQGLDDDQLGPILVRVGKTFPTKGSKSSKTQQDRPTQSPRGADIATTLLEDVAIRSMAGDAYASYVGRVGVDTNAADFVKHLLDTNGAVAADDEEHPLLDSVRSLTQADQRRFMRAVKQQHDAQTADSGRMTRSSSHSV